MHYLSRRQFLASTAAASTLSAIPTLIGSRTAALAAEPTVIRAGTRVIEVAGRPATVFGLLQPDGTHGLFAEAGQPFRVRLENRLEAPTLIHWHGLIPPYGQAGVPDPPQPLLPAGQSYSSDFPLTTTTDKSRVGNEWVSTFRYRGW